MEGNDSNSTSNIFLIISSNGANKEAWENLLCDINSDSDDSNICKEIILILKKKLIDKSSVELILDILDFLIHYGEETIVELIAKNEFLKCIFSLLKNNAKSSVNVQKKIIFLIQKWAKKYENDKNKPNFFQNYNSLKKAGIKFPSESYKMETYTKYISEEEAQSMQMKAKTIKKIKDENKKMESTNEKKSEEPSSPEKQLNEKKDNESDNKNNNNLNNEENLYSDKNNKEDDESMNKNNLNNNNKTNNDNNINDNEKNIDNANNDNNINNNKSDINDKDNNNKNEQINNNINQKENVDDIKNNNKQNNILHDKKHETINKEICPLGHPKNNNNDNNLQEQHNEQCSRYPKFPSKIGDINIFNNNNENTVNKNNNVGGRNNDTNNQFLNNNNNNINNKYITPMNDNRTTNYYYNNYNNTNKNYNMNLNNNKNNYENSNYNRKDNISDYYKVKDNNMNNYYRTNTGYNNNTFNKTNDPFSNNSNFAHLNANTFDVIDFKRTLGNKLLKLNGWINEGKYSFNSVKLKEEIKEIINEISKCDYMMNIYQLKRDNNAYNIVRNMKLDVEQTCARYEDLLKDKYVQPFQSSFCGNNRQYYFDKNKLAGNQGNALPMGSFDNYYKGISGAGVSGSNYNYGYKK